MCFKKIFEIPSLMLCTMCIHFVYNFNLCIRICIILDSKVMENNIEPAIEHGPKLGIN